MNDIFKNLIEEIMIVYLDNILIFTWTLENYYKTAYKVLKVLAKHKLLLHFEKCEFGKWQIGYLELVISQDQVVINSAKVAGVCNWPTLHNYTDI